MVCQKSERILTAMLGFHEGNGAETGAGRWIVLADIVGGTGSCGPTRRCIGGAMLVHCHSGPRSHEAPATRLHSGKFRGYCTCDRNFAATSRNFGITSREGVPVTEFRRRY